ncbi:uncharacterized protein [Populus alba]|uniref:uncharacterized protein n=1 Tax=Populus alba TaxID=43335 RepID=UPI003CC6E1BC
MEGHHIEDCVKFRQKVAKMLLMGELRLETLGGNQEVSMMEGQDKLSEVCRVQLMANGFSKLILTKPSFTKRDHSAMPYNYVCTSSMQAPLPLFHSEVSGLTRSGRCFTPEELKKAKGKEMVDLDKEVEVNEPVTEKESNEFLRLIKHRTGHNKPLYITVKCKDFLIGKVLVDNGSALNVLPKYILKEMLVDESHMKPSTITARAYDGSPRPVLGNLEVELYVGPQMFLTTFQVMDIHPSYSMLLGRPWIHTAGAVPSSLHQCLKYIMNGMLVTVKAEETISMVKNVTIPFLEAEDCTDENLHAFEIVNTEWVPESTVLRKPKISAAVKMAVRCFLEHGIPFQYDPITGIPKRIKPITMRAVDQRFGLGYKPKKEDHRWAANKRRERRMARIEGRDPEEEEEMEIPPLMVSFPKAAYVMQPDNRAEDDIQRMATMSINTLEDDKEEGSGTKTVVEMEDEVLPQLTVEMEDDMLPQLTVHTLEELPTKTFVRRLAEGCDQSKKELKIGTLITPKQTAELSALLHEYSDVFAWSYKDMPGLNTNIVVHKIPLEEGCKPVKQKLRRAHPETWIKVKAELEKQWNAGFLEVVTYPQWVSNIVVVPKKEGKIRVCVDFRDLNKASPKDDFPLPHIDILVDNAARSSTYSFMDGFSGYNQIKMATEDRAKTTFVTPWGTYCYKVMLFGLKNAGATYQRAMVTLFHDMMHKEIEVYVDDMIAKSKEGEDHVKSGMLLGFVVSEKGIEVDPDKAKAIQSMPTPKSEKEHDETGRKERAIYYLSKKFTELDPLRYICNKPYLSSRIARWQVLLSEYDIIYMTRKAVKGSVIADHLADNAIEEYEPLDFDFPDENLLSIEREEEMTDWWTMFFDGAVNVYGNGAGAVIVKGEWQTKEEKLKPYQEYLSSLLGSFEKIKFTHLGREGNHFADALATLAAMATIDLGHRVQPVHIDIRNNPAYCYSIEEEIDGKPWYYDIKNFVQKQEYPEEASKTDRKTIRRLAMSFYLDGEILYKRSFDGTLLRCLSATDAKKALQEVHEGICSTHASGHMMARKIQRAGYF